MQFERRLIELNGLIGSRFPSAPGRHLAGLPGPREGFHVISHIVAHGFETVEKYEVPSVLVGNLP